MGFDLYGLNPRSPRGEYFRSNVWWWRPLWRWVALNNQGILSDADIEMGDYNSGYTIGEEKALKLAELILSSTGDIQRQEPGPLLQGPQQEFYKRDRLESLDKSYRFSAENMLDFAEFCRESGGFRIW